MNEKLSIPTIRVAARRWYQRDKESAIKGNKDAQALLYWIIDQVIAHRKARAFILPVNSRHPIIDFLFDSRLLHIIKRGMSGQEKAGVRYDAYKLDYGCYVDLLATKSAPTSQYGEGLGDPVTQTEETWSGAAETTETENESAYSKEADLAAAQVVVPTDDYRAIRRAILDLSAFEERTQITLVPE